MLTTQSLRFAHKSAKKPPPTNPMLLFLWSCVKIGVVSGVAGVATGIVIEEIEISKQKNSNKKRSQ